MQQAAALAAAAVAAVLLLIGVRVLALPFPVLVTSLILFARMSGPAQLLQNSVVSTAAYAPAFAAIERRLGPLDWTLPAEVKHEPLDWDVLQLDKVSFIHPSGHGLRQVSLQLAAGEWLGVAGASGAGKTTLVDLVAGLIAPQHGSIQVDKGALSDPTLERWRAGLAYVGQEASVFNNSVRANLLSEGAEASDEILWQALATVGLAERVRRMPAGLDEEVGDRGSQLSGGERQRLVLARALLRRPSLLILDEATAALDADSEAALIDRLKAQVPRPAAIVVAHRESTLRHCDSVITIQHGAVSRTS
jgi:ATP-binding cassette subfamily C protein